METAAGFDSAMKSSAQEEGEDLKSNDSGDQKEESLCDQGSQGVKKKRRRRRRKSKKQDKELENELSDNNLEEILLEKPQKQRPKSATERIEMKKNKEKEETPSTHVDEKAGNNRHDTNQGGETPQSHKHRRRRHSKKKTDTEDGEIQQNNENVATLNATPKKEQSTPRKRDSSKKHQTPLSKKRAYEKYLSLEQVSDGLKCGELLKGTIRISKKNFELAWVTIDGMRRDVVLEGMLARNRALEGDIVALKVSARDKWKIMKMEFEDHKAAAEKKENDGMNELVEELKDAHLSQSDTKSPPNQKSKEKIDIADVPDEFLQQTATVVYIIEKKHSRAAGGHLKPFNSRNKEAADGLFVPTDSRLPRLRIPHDSCPPGFFERPQDFANSLFVARITEWRESSPFDSYLAVGTIMRSLGEAGEIVPETEAIFTEYEIDYGPFPDEALACLPKTPWAIPEEEINKRRDFRDECVFTIDPLTARDLDDALHCKQLPDGNIEVGVHIADVSYFVRQGTALDEVAQNRATSTYMVQTVVPMLPRLLCEELCSLNPDEDRLTMSVVWTMNDKGEILSDWKGRSVIRSRVKLAYEHAHDMIQKPNKKWEEGELPPISEGTDAAEIASKVLMLHKIAVQLRRNRFANGALRLDQVNKFCNNLQ